jgi:hypothetical protein
VRPLALQVLPVPCLADMTSCPTSRFIFVAPGVIAQVQPKFIANRDIFEAREKKAKIYSACRLLLRPLFTLLLMPPSFICPSPILGWKAFILGEIVSIAILRIVLH